MPEIITYAKPAREIKSGNYLFSKKVLSNDTRRTKCTILLDGLVDNKASWDFNLTDMLEVGVLEDTQEEKAAKAEETRLIHRDLFTKAVRALHDESLKKLEAAENTRAERIEAGWGMLDYSTLDRQLSAYAHHDVTRTIAFQWSEFDDGKVHVHEGDHKYTDGKCTIPSDELTEFDMAVRIVKNLHRVVVKGAYQMRVLSRSTSITSNLADDLVQQARAEIISSLRWNIWGIDELDFLHNVL